MHNFIIQSMSNEVSIDDKDIKTPHSYPSCGMTLTIFEYLPRPQEVLDYQECPNCYDKQPTTSDLIIKSNGHQINYISCGVCNGTLIGFTVKDLNKDQLNQARINGQEWGERNPYKDDPLPELPDDELKDIYIVL
jgi:hypothetical protein